MEFHEKLQMLRKERGMTQEDLANRLYVSRTAVSKWERGRGIPEIGSLQAIARLFSVSLDSLLSEEAPRAARGRRFSLWFGIADLSAAALWFLPLFAARKEGAVRAVSLWSLAGVIPWVFAAAVLAAVGMGVLSLVLKEGRFSLWDRARCKLSFAFSGMMAVLFAAALHPYAAFFAIGLLLWKGILLLR